MDANQLKQILGVFAETITNSQQQLVQQLLNRPATTVSESMLNIAPFENYDPCC